MKDIFNQLHRRGYSNIVISQWTGISVAKLKKYKKQRGNRGYHVGTKTLKKLIAFRKIDPKTLRYK